MKLLVDTDEYLQGAEVAVSSLLARLSNKKVKMTL